LNPFGFIFKDKGANSPANGLKNNLTMP